MIITVLPSPFANEGFHDCQIKGSAFVGPASSYFFDYVTDYWFKTTGAAFGGGASRVLIETANPAALPEQWAVQNVPASQTNVVMSAQVSTNFDTFKAVRNGWVVGLATRLTEAITGGTLTVEVTINGVGTGFMIVHTSGSNPSGGVVVTYIPLAAAYAASDLIGIRFTTDAGFTPTTTDLEAYVEVVEEVP
jgi:hypothetical protein